MVGPNLSDLKCTDCVCLWDCICRVSVDQKLVDGFFRVLGIIGIYLDRSLVGMRPVLNLEVETADTKNIYTA